MRPALALVAALGIGTAAAHAQNATWVGDGSPAADWNTNTNWTPTTVPSGAATFDGTGSATIVFTIR